MRVQMCPGFVGAVVAAVTPVLAAPRIPACPDLGLAGPAPRLAGIAFSVVGSGAGRQQEGGRRPWLPWNRVMGRAWGGGGGTGAPRQGQVG